MHCAAVQARPPVFLRLHTPQDPDSLIKGHDPGLNILTSPAFPSLPPALKLPSCCSLPSRLEQQLHIFREGEGGGGQPQVRHPNDHPPHKKGPPALCELFGIIDKGNEGREVRTPNLLIWSQTRCRCAIPPMSLASTLSICRKGMGLPLCHEGLRTTACASSRPASAFASFHMSGSPPMLHFKHSRPPSKFVTVPSDTQQPPWPNGQGVGLLIRRLRVRVPQGVLCLCPSLMH